MIYVINFIDIDFVQTPSYVLYFIFVLLVNLGCA